MFAHKLFAFVLSAAIAVAGTRRLTPIYESHTMLAIEDKDIFAPTMDRFVQPQGGNRDQLRHQQYQAMIETRVKSNDFLRSIIEDLGIHRSPDVRDRIASMAPEERQGAEADELVMRHFVGALKKKIEVQNPRIGFFTISVFDTDPATAFILARKLTEKFIEVTRQDQIQGVRQAGAFSDEQLADQAYRLYEKFRPSVPPGVKGWGKAGELNLDVITSLAPRH